MKKIKIVVLIVLLLAFVGVMVYAVRDALPSPGVETSAVSNPDTQNDTPINNVYNPVDTSIYIKFECGEMAGYEVVDPNGNVIDSGDADNSKNKD